MFDILNCLAKARYVPDLSPEVAYAVLPSFFIGSLRKPQPNDLRDQAVALFNPGFVRKQQALGLAVEGHELQLVRYYREVLRTMQQHRKELRANTLYFSLSPVLLTKGKPLVTFPWYDTYPEAASLLRALQQAGTEQLLLDDLDQGWQGAIYARGEHVYFAQGDGEATVPSLVCYTDRARLRELAAATLARTERQVAGFVRETGQNPWRYHA